MGPTIIIVALPGLSELPGLHDRIDPVHIQKLITQSSIEGFNMSIVGWCSRLREAQSDLVRVSPLINDLQVNSAPLSQNAAFGTPRKLIRPFSTAATCSPRSLGPTSIASASLANTSITVRRRSFEPLANRSWTKSILQASLGRVDDSVPAGASPFCRDAGSFAS